MAVNSERIYLGNISFQLQESFILCISGLSWSIIWNFDTSVSTCVEVVLSAVELQNMKVRNLRYYISNSSQIQGLWNACYVLPWPPQILSYTVNFIDRGNRTKPASMSEFFWLYKCDQASPLELGQAICTVCVSCQYCHVSLLLI